MMQNSCQSKPQLHQLASSRSDSKNISTEAKTQHKQAKKKPKAKTEKHQQNKLFKKTSKRILKAGQIEPSRAQKWPGKESKANPAHHTTCNSRKKNTMERLISSSLKNYSTEKRRNKQLTKSRQKLVQEMKQSQISTRRGNLKKFPPTQSSKITERLAWGADETRIKKHVILTIQRLKRMKSASRSSSESPKKRDRDAVGLGFLDKLSPEKVQRLVLKSHASQRDLSSSSSSRLKKCHGSKLRTQQSESDYLHHKVGIMQNYDTCNEKRERVMPCFSRTQNIGVIKKVVPL